MRTLSKTVEGAQKKPIFFWGSASGSSEGGRTILTLSGGRIPWQNLFLQLPWQRGRCFCTASLMKKWSELPKSTGANLSNLDQTLFLWLPISMTQDLAQRGSKFLSCLIVRTHMVVIACGAFVCGGHGICQEWFYGRCSETWGCIFPLDNSVTKPHDQGVSQPEPLMKLEDIFCGGWGHW